jgi:hypothetical protein
LKPPATKRSAQPSTPNQASTKPDFLILEKNTMEKDRNIDIHPIDKRMALVLGETVMANLLETWPTVIIPPSYSGEETVIISEPKPVISQFMSEKPA